MVADEEWEKIHLEESSKRQWFGLIFDTGTNPVDDNAKLFHQSLPVEEVVGSDQEIPRY